MTSLESVFSGNAIIYEASLFRGSQEQAPTPYHLGTTLHTPVETSEKLLENKNPQCMVVWAPPFTDWRTFS